MRVFGFAGWSGSGKTTLIEQLVPRLITRGFTVSLVKHAHHRFELDQPGKDSWRHREAGCTEVLLTSSTRWALMHELRGAAEPTWRDALGHLSPCDFALVEGFKNAALPKLEIWRSSIRKPLLLNDDPWIRAVATDLPDTLADVAAGGRQVFRLDAFDEIATLVVKLAAVHPSCVDDTKVGG
ncbi:MAG: molybdopterin-guanine dinucleotide biosynthesis protein B [Pseudomonadota bacterium]|nr:molybdopterin-guanine dinucleotide biosynthesis protein B [Pseudomonadota bacterium]